MPSVITETLISVLPFHYDIMMMMMMMIIIIIIIIIILNYRVIAPVK